MTQRGPPRRSDDQGYWFVRKRYGYGATPSTWLLESADALEPWNWTAVSTINFDRAGTRSVTDRGQNGRPFPGLVQSRLYRLVHL